MTDKERGAVADQHLLPGYLIIGPDEVKRNAAITRMKTRLEESGMADFNLDDRDMAKDDDVDGLLSSLNTFPMGSDFRLVILRGCDHLAKPLSDALVSYLANPSPTTVCIIVASALAKNTRLYKAVAKIDAKAVIDCSAKKRWELPAQVQDMAKKHGKQIAQNAAEELISRVGENTRMLDNELKRLSEMVEAPQIDRSDVEALIARTAEVQPWDFLNAVSERNLIKSLELLRLMPSKNNVWVYTLLVARIRELVVAKSLDARGQGRELAQVLGVQSWRVKNHLAWARKYSMQELLGALKQARDVELALKGSRDSDLAMESWVCGFVGK